MTKTNNEDKNEEDDEKNEEETETEVDEQRTKDEKEPNNLPLSSIHTNGLLYNWNLFHLQ